MQLLYINKKAIYVCIKYKKKIYVYIIVLKIKNVKYIKALNKSNYV